MRVSKTILAAISAVSLGLGAAGAAAAGTTIYDTAGAPGNQQWTGTLGLDFTVNSAVLVDALGAFDAGADGFGDAAIHVTIFDSLGHMVTSVADFTGANPGATNYVFQAITPTLLAPGAYQVAAWGYGFIASNFNNSGPGGPITFNDLGGALTAVSSHYSNSDAPGAYATNPDNGATRYGAGSFQASVVSVPEPTSWALLITGFGGIGAMLRRRRPVFAA